MGRKNMELQIGKNDVYMDHISRTIENSDITMDEFYLSMYAYIKNRMPKVTVLNHKVNLPPNFLKKNDSWMFHKQVYNLNSLENCFNNVKWDYLISDSESVRKIHYELFLGKNMTKLIVVDLKIDDKVKSFYPMHIQELSKKDIKEYKNNNPSRFNKISAIENRIKNFFIGIHTYFEINPVNYQAILMDNAKNYVEEYPEKARGYVGNAWTYKPEMVKEILEYMKDNSIIAKYHDSELILNSNPSKDLITTELSKIKKYTNKVKTKLSDLL